MRKIILATALAAAISGCAVVPATLAPQQLTNVQLCDAFFTAPEDVAAAAGAEATQRGVNCAQMRDEVARYQQERNAARAEAAGAWLSTPYSRPVACTSVRNGVVVRTVCN